MFEWEVEPNSLKFKYQDISVEIKRHSMGFLLGYLIVNKDNSLFGKSDDDLVPLFKDIAEITYADFSDNGWQIGVDFGHMKDYIPNEPISESVVSSLRVFCEDKVMDDFLTDFEAWCQKNKAKVADYKSIEYVSNLMQKMAEKAQTFQGRIIN